MKSRPNTPLALCAAALATLLVVQLLRPVDSTSAYAELVSRAGSLIALTAEAGNEEVLVLLDDRSETLLVYRTDLRSGIQLMQRVPVDQLFRDARARAVGAP